MTAKIGIALEDKLASAPQDELLEVNVFLRGEPTELLAGAQQLESYDPSSPISALKQWAFECQRGLLSLLSEPSTLESMPDSGVAQPLVSGTRSHWITNAVSTRIHRSRLAEITARADVLRVELVRSVELSELFDTGGPAIRDFAETPAAEPPLLATAGEAPTITWSVERIGAPRLWELGIEGQGVLVAVMDSGINYNHPDLAGRLWDGGAERPHHGWDFANDDDDPMDHEGHGTCCAGIVAGTGALGTRTGVAPKATVMGLRLGSKDHDFWDAFEFALEHKAHVITMSLSWKYPNADYTGWRRLCETLLAAGVLHANSIGNQGTSLDTFPIPYNIGAPGNCPPPRLHPLQLTVGATSSAIACGATNEHDELASFSGRGPAAWEVAPDVDYPYSDGAKMGLLKPDVCAPGPGSSSLNARYGTVEAEKPYVDFGGTSAATPHVAGALALLVSACLEQSKPIVPANILEALESTAERIEGQTQDKENHYGAGRINVSAAFNYGHTKGWW